MEIREEDYHIQLIDMEYGIHEQIAKASDGHHTIFLNARDAHKNFAVPVGLTQNS